MSSALLTESGLSAPQLVLNCKKRAVKGLSVLMVVGFLFGDCYKLAYFLLRASPVQFVACAAVQIAIDGAICLQICFFKGGSGSGGDDDAATDAADALPPSVSTRGSVDTSVSNTRTHYDGCPEKLAAAWAPAHCVWDARSRSGSSEGSVAKPRYTHRWSAR